VISESHLNPDRKALLQSLLRIGKREPEITRRLAALEPKPPERPEPPGRSQRPIED
jgi:hypothetical protein